MPHIQHLHLLAILMSTMVLWILGAIWYSPVLFAKPWMKLLGIEKDGPNKKNIVPGMLASFVGDFILAFMLAHFVTWSSSTTFGSGALIGIVVWIGFFAAPNLPQGIYENRPFKLFAINNGYWLVGLPLVGGLIASWR